MPKISNPKYLPKLPRYKQRTLSHCGPAVLCMQVGFLGIKTDQDDYVKASGIPREKLRKNGMDMDEMALSVLKLLPQLNFWVKCGADINDIQTITNKYNYPAGVEWQGVFGEWSNGDDGHYSIIAHVNQSQKKLVLIDPFWYYSGSDRIFSTDLFMKRWWDVNFVIDKKRGQLIRVTDRQVLFVITKKSDLFPKRLGMENYKIGKYVRYGAYVK